MKILDKNFETLEADFNLTHMIIDYKERQREKIMIKMKENFEKIFMKHKHAKDAKHAEAEAHKQFSLPKARGHTPTKYRPSDDHLPPTIHS